MIKTYTSLRAKRHARVSAKLSATASLPRLSVFRSSQHIYAQVIDNKVGKTLASASDLQIKETGTKTARAEQVGKLIAEKAKAVKVSQVVFDRGGFAYHGRVKALAEGARKAGLKF